MNSANIISPNFNLILIGEVRKFLELHYDIENTKDFFAGAAHRIVKQKRENWGGLLHSSHLTKFDHAMEVLFPLFEMRSEQWFEKNHSGMQLISRATDTAVSLIVRDLLPTSFVTKNKNTEDDSIGNFFEFVAQVSPDRQKIVTYFQSVDPQENIFCEEIWSSLHSSDGFGKIRRWGNSYYNLSDRIRTGELSLLGWTKKDYPFFLKLVRAIVRDLCMRGLLSGEPDTQMRRLIDRHRSYRVDLTFAKNEHGADRIFTKKLLTSSSPLPYQKVLRNHRGAPGKLRQ